MNPKQDHISCHVIKKSHLLEVISFHDSDLTGFFAYEGSLTYPNCDEIVQWIVMDTPLYVRRDGLVSIEQTLFLLLGPQTYCFSSML